jgi:hypothetical protein
VCIIHTCSNLVSNTDNLGFDSSKMMQFSYLMCDGGTFSGSKAAGV